MEIQQNRHLFMKVIQIISFLRAVLEPSVTVDGVKTLNNWSIRLYDITFAMTWRRTHLVQTNMKRFVLLHNMGKISC